MNRRHFLQSVLAGAALGLATSTGLAARGPLTLEDAIAAELETAGIDGKFVDYSPLTCGWEPYGGANWHTRGMEFYRFGGDE